MRIPAGGRVLFVACGVVWSVWSAAGATSERAVNADAFVDSIGVNTHLYYDSYQRIYDSIVKPRLGELGIRHIRDSAHAGDRRYYRRIRELNALYGIDLNLVTDPTITSGAAVRDLIVSELGVDAVGSIEGVNEPEIFLRRVVGDGWISLTRAHQQDLFQTLKSDPRTAGIPILGPSFTGIDHAERVGSLRAYLDYGNLHSYPGARPPETRGWGSMHNGTFYGSLAYNMRNIAALTSGPIPQVTTETGYHTSPLSLNSSHPPTSETAFATYLPRLFLHYFNSGIARSFSYEFLDQRTGAMNLQLNYGLVRSDGSVKLAFHAIKNLIAALKDPGPSFIAGDLSYTLSGNTKDLYRALFQKRDGTFYLALWLGKASWNPATLVPERVVPQSVTLALRSDVKTVATNVPVEGARWWTRNLVQGRVTLQITEKVMIFRIPPQAAGLPDLVVSSVWVSPATPTAGDRLTLHATIRNRGTAITSAVTPYTVDFAVDDGWRGSTQLRGLAIAPGQSATVIAGVGSAGTWLPAGGTRRITATVNPQGTIAEQNHANNALSISTPIASASSIFAAEAEAGRLYPPMAIRTDLTASGGAYVMVPPGIRVGAAAAEFTVTVPRTGGYSLKAVVNGPTLQSDSLRVQIDNGALVDWHLPVGPGWRSAVFPDRVPLSAGAHRLRIYGRESGAKLDRVELVSRP